jgi:hypothetical protein
MRIDCNLHFLAALSACYSFDRPALVGVLRLAPNAPRSETNGRKRACEAPIPLWTGRRPELGPLTD